MQEKRKFERFHINVPARVEISNRKGRSKKLNIETINLSAGGIFLKMGKPPPEGTLVKVEIFLHFEEFKTPTDPEGTLIITTSGSVKRSGRDGTAISFNEDYDITTSLDLTKKEK